MYTSPLSPPFSTTLCSFLLPLCHLSCAHFPKQNWAQLEPCWPIIQQIITRLMIENWRQSHSGRLKWSHNGRLMHFSEQIRKQSQEIDSVSLQVNANKIISSPPKIRNLCPRRRVSLTDHLECLLLRDGHGILRLMITGEISLSAGTLVGTQKLMHTNGHPWWGDSLFKPIHGSLENLFVCAKLQPHS